VEPGTQLAVELQRHLAAKGWTQSALARRASLGRTIVSQALNGHALPSVRTVTLLAKALACELEPLLALRQLAEQPVNDPGRSIGGGVLVLDVGSVDQPGAFIGVGEVRFSVSNFGNIPVKVKSIVLRVVRATPIAETQGRSTAAPIDEYFLYAKLSTATREVELLTRHHILTVGATDGFFLRVDGAEAYVFELEIVASWHVVGSTDDRESVSPLIKLAFPAYSVDGLLEVARRSQENPGGQ
jgi:hypothetical protein